MYGVYVLAVDGAIKDVVDHFQIREIDIVRFKNHTALFTLFEIIGPVGSPNAPEFSSVGSSKVGFFYCLF